MIVDASSLAWSRQPPPAGRPAAMPLSPTAHRVLRALSVVGEAAPGRLVALTGRSWNAVEEALRRLEAGGHAVARPAGRGRVWRRSGVAARPLLPPPALRLVEAVAGCPGISVAAAAAAAGMQVSEASRHAAALEAEGRLRRVRLGRATHLLPA